MKKHCYEIIINQLPKKYTEIIYDYSATKGKGIKLKISNNAVHIIAHLSSLYENDAIVVSTNNIFSDAIKKALLIHLIIYSKNICIKNMFVSIDGEKSDIPIPVKGTTPPICSLVVNELEHKPPKGWTNTSFLCSIACRSRSTQDTRWAALFAALCAKSKTFEIERFIYLWMSFNGIYNYFSKKINNLRPPTPKGMKQRVSEKDELQWMLQLYGLGNEAIERTSSKRIANEVISILKNADISEIQSIDDLPEELKTQIESVLIKKDGTKYDLSAYGYLLVSFAYYFRCNVFHAKKPLPLFCYADEVDLKCLHLVNTLLENFIDNQLNLIFDATYIDKMFAKKIEQVAKHTK